MGHEQALSPYPKRELFRTEVRSAQQGRNGRHHQGHQENRKPGDRHVQIIEKCLSDWQAEFKAARESTSGADNSLVAKFVIELYEQILERQPTDSELDENIGQFKLYLSKLDRQKAIAKLVESLVLSTEFAYRNEFVMGEADEHGRRLMSPRNASYALAYALTDDGPDEKLAKAAEEGNLDSRKDYEREIRRLLAVRDKWNIIDENVQAANLNPSVTNQPIRKLRFFREFFGYPKAQSVFKDDSRFGAGRHEQAVSRTDRRGGHDGRAHPPKKTSKSLRLC